MSASELSDSIQVAFKGSRDYVHGTDLVSAVTDLLSESEGFISEIVFREPIRSHPVVWEQRHGSQSEHKKCSVTWEGADGSARFFELGESGRQIESRYPYEEGLVLNSFHFDGFGGQGPGYSEYSFIENVVAMTKGVNLLRHRPIDGQWVFSRGRFESSLPGTWGEISVSSREVASPLVSANSIAVDGREIGVLMFMVGKL